MTIYLVNAVPNAFLTTWDCTKIKKISPEEAFLKLTRPNHFADYDDNVAPQIFKKEAVSAIGHESTAQLLESIFTKFNGFYLNEPIKFVVPFNRITIELEQNDVVIASVCVPPRRLAEGELWTKEEMESFDIQFLLMYNGASEENDYTWRYEMTKFA